MVCNATIEDYALRSIGIGEKLLPKSDITLCDQFVLIGSGVIWNLYFCIIALAFGFIFAILTAIIRFNKYRVLSKAIDIYVFIFRGSPLFIQFFCAYEIFVLLLKLVLILIIHNYYRRNLMANKSLAWCCTCFIPKYNRIQL